ncbi:MAG: outer membrane lipoprotein-sorting protein [Azospirillaceae bacterium]
MATSPSSSQADPSARTPGGFFGRIVAWRWPVLILGLMVIAAGISQIPRLEKDTSAGAFIDPENPALVYRDRVEEIFGLRDPIVVAVVADEAAPEGGGAGGVYTPETLQLVDRLTDRLLGLDNVDPDRVVSLATESTVVGTDIGMEVPDFFDPVPQDEVGAASVRAAAEAFPLYHGNLVARDGRATVIVAELIDEDAAQATYDAIRDVTASAETPPGVTLHVAGEGAIAGFLSTYIDRDAAKLNPLAGLIITAVLFAAFLTIRGALVPNLIVLATVALTLGLMAASGVAFYVITNGLIVCLIGIAVADSVHVFSEYYESIARDPDRDRKAIVAEVMREKWRPITFTSLTTIAGFLAFWPTNDMPPIRYFGLYGAVGVAIAWVYSLTVLPAILAMLPARPSRAFRGDGAAGRQGVPARAMGALGGAVLARPGLVIGFWAVVVVAGVAGASQVVVNDSRINNFEPSEPLYRADKRINAVMDGTYNLDVVIETEGREGLFDPAVLRGIEDLQAFLETLPHVNGTTSIVDYIKQMNKAVNENRDAAYAIPDDPNLIAQLFLLYEVSGDPTDLEEEVDYERRRALVRAYLDTGEYTNNAVVVPAVEQWLDENFDLPGVTATPTGRVNVDYHWINGVDEDHAASVVVSAAAVMAMAGLLFRSAVAGLLAGAPVVVSILLIYAVMGFAGIWLGVGTSMFAAIAIGLGVDFAIHALDRLHRQLEEGGSMRDALARLYPTTGRALFFNFAALVLGFGVLVTSDVPPLVKFGALVAVAVSTAFLASLTLLPALALVLRPRFLTGGAGASTGGGVAATAGKAALALGVAGGLALGAGDTTRAQEMPSGDALMAEVDAREEGEHATADITLELTDRSGTSRVQEIRSFRKYFGEEKRTVLFYEEPTNVRGTAFLTYDYPDPSVDDDQWLYLPALRKVRRIAASDRGDYFLGTDFTYEEIKKQNKVELSDYTFATTGTETVNGVETYVVEGTPVSDAIAEEIGYGRVVWRIDPEIDMSLVSDYWDVNGNPLKTITNERIEEIDGIWTSMVIRAENHKTGHSTVFTNANVDYEESVPDRMFEQQMLRRGL